ncbi:hypothetical protein AGLY_011116 [Aphis glycines]|uniref:Secreted protein n=1 Tax=Aphis glycines TaxID=307491 RepID=A0A6G0TDV1_APHGL|nr:hypothetical protein AGLY_011116 [Aphis glycines]
MSHTHFRAVRLVILYLTFIKQFSCKNVIVSPAAAARARPSLCYERSRLRLRAAHGKRVRLVVPATVCVCVCVCVRARAQRVSHTILRLHRSTSVRRQFTCDDDVPPPPPPQTPRRPQLPRCLRPSLFTTIIIFYHTPNALETVPIIIIGVGGYRRLFYLIVRVWTCPAAVASAHF